MMNMLEGEVDELTDATRYPSDTQAESIRLRDEALADILYGKPTLYGLDDSVPTAPTPPPPVAQAQEQARA